MQKITGVYTIKCTANGVLYVGRSINIKSRWSDHRKKLRSGEHYNQHMQNAFNKYGESEFAYSVALVCNERSTQMYEQLLADGYKKIGATLFNCGDFLDSPARGKKRPDHSKRLKAMHADKETKKLIMRGVAARSSRIKGTDVAVAYATYASRSRKRKPACELKRKPYELCLHKGTPEHSAMISVAMKQRYLDGILKPNLKGIPVARNDTGEVFISAQALADELGVTKQAVIYQLKQGVGVCKGVPISYANNDASVQTVKP